MQIIKFQILSQLQSPFTCLVHQQNYYISDSQIEFQLKFDTYRNNCLQNNRVFIQDLLSYYNLIQSQMGRKTKRKTAQHTALYSKQIEYCLKMAKNSEELNKYEEAIQSYKAALSLYSKYKMKDRKKVAELLQKKAELHKLLNKHMQAQDNLRESLKILRQFQSQPQQITLRLNTMEKIIAMQNIQIEEKNKSKEENILSLTNKKEVLLKLQEEAAIAFDNQQVDNSLKILDFKRKVKDAKFQYQAGYDQKALKLLVKAYQNHRQNQLQPNQDLVDALRLAIGDIKSTKIAQHYFEYALNEFNLKNYDDSLKLYISALKMVVNLQATNQKYLELFKYGIVEIGSDYQQLQQYKNLHKLNLEVQSLLLQLNLRESEVFARIIYELGLSLHYLKQYHASNQKFLSFLEVLKYLSQKDKDFFVSKSQQYIDKNFYQMKNQCQSIDHFQAAIIKIASYLNILGKLFYNKQMYEEAEMTFIKEVAILKQSIDNKKLQFKQKLSQAHLNVARVCFKLDKSQVCIDNLHESSKLCMLKEHKGKVQIMLAKLVNICKSKSRIAKIKQIAKKYSAKLSVIDDDYHD